MRQWQPSLNDPNVRVEGLAELEQAIAIVLTSPLGSVAGNPSFGSRLFELVDAPANIVRTRAPAEVLRALKRWEPRVTVVETSVQSATEDGRLVLEVYWHPAATPDAAARRTEVAL